MATKNPAPDDDPLFAQWLRDSGRVQELPEVPDFEEVSTPLVAAFALFAGGVGIVVALGWAALAFAVGVGVWSTTAVVLMTVGTVLVIAGAVVAYLARRSP